MIRLQIELLVKIDVQLIRRALVRRLLVDEFSEALLGSKTGDLRLPSQQTRYLGASTILMRCLLGLAFSKALREAASDGSSRVVLATGTFVIPMCLDRARQRRGQCLLGQLLKLYLILAVGREVGLRDLVLGIVYREI